MLRRSIFLYNSQKCQRCNSQESREWTTGKRTQKRWGANVWFGQVQKYGAGEGSRESIDYKLDVGIGNCRATGRDQGKNNSKMNRRDSESIKRREGLGEPKASVANVQRNFRTTNGIRRKEEVQLRLRRK